MRRHFIWLLAAAGCSGGVICSGATLDSNFSESVFANAGAQITGMAWAPDGSDRLFVTRKGGNIEIIKNGVRLATPFATVDPVFTSSECGLIGICFDPNFTVNGYVYVFATTSSTQQKIFRYTAVGDVGTDKTGLITGLPTIGANHDGGAIGIGPDGKLYWAIGDNGNGTGVDNNLSSLASKVGRANLDGSVPADNPFADGPGGNNDYIWARGFRNPFTLNFQPATGDLWVNCVGTSYEQIFLVNAGDHAGWDNYENTQPDGYLKPKIKYRTNGTDTRNLTGGSGAARANNVVTFMTTVAHGFHPGEQIQIAGVSDPGFNGTLYVDSVPNATTFTAAQPGPDAVSGGGQATTLSQGGCVTGGCFYDSTAVPPAYRGDFFYGDFNSDRIMRATLGTSNEVLAVDYFGTNVDQAIDMAVGPDGALYYASHGGTIYRLAYTNFTSQQVVVTPTVVRMLENGAATVTIRLAQEPSGDIDVNVTRTSGDSNIQVTDGAILTFSPANWAVPQVVRLEAMPDADATNGIAGLTVSAAGVSSESVTVHAAEVVISASVGIEPGSSAGEPVTIHLEGEPGSTYILEGNTNPAASWTPLSTNTLIGSSTNILDLDSPDFPLRLYRARRTP